MNLSKAIASFLLLFFLLGYYSISAQDTSEETGLPGDHFSLEAALELFKNSKSPEDFEKKLNTEDSKVNNLDLDEDGKTDYVRVIDNMDGDVHAIVLTVPMGKNESQDIAVIEIEKTGNKSAILQIVGDEDIYGEQVLVEPYAVENEEGEKGGPSDAYNPVIVSVNVWGWTSVSYIYGPSYVVWVSPWSYLYYPPYYRPWTPFSWTVWHPYRVRYRPHYHVVHTHRVVRAHKVYTPRRKTTTVVATRTKVAKSKGAVYTTNSKARKNAKTAVANNANGKTVAGSKKTTTVAGKTADGKKVTATKTSATVVGKNADGDKIAATKTKTSIAGKSADGKAVAASKSKATAAGKSADGKKAVATKTTQSKGAKSANGKKVKTSKSTTKAAASSKKGKAAGKKTTTTKKAKGKKGNVAGKKTTTKKTKKKKNG